MAYCTKCGKEVHDEAEICIHCGCRIKNAESSFSDGKNGVRFVLTFFFGWLGSVIINHSSLKPDGWTSRSFAYFFFNILTFGIYPLVASICCLSFDPSKPSNIGFYKDNNQK